MMMIRLLFMLSMLSLFILTACSSRPVERQEVRDGVTITYLTGSDSESSRPTEVPRIYIVERGDSLFSIARRYGLDYREIAELNDLGANYVIMPGQELRLRGGLLRNLLRSRRPSSSDAINSPNSPNTIRSSQRDEQDSPEENTNQDDGQALGFIDDTPPPLSRRGWLWPIDERPDFSTDNVRGGTFITSALGARVRAVNNGRVVYVGSELEDYGRLVMISHQDGYLSLYGQNTEILVQSDQIVERGDSIAIVGNAAGRGRLYFEIRSRGDIIDPSDLILADN